MKTIPQPFNLSHSKKQKLDIGIPEKKEEFVPLKVQVEKVFTQLRSDVEGWESLPASGKQSC